MSVRFDEGLCDRNPFCPVVKACPTGAMYVDRKTYRPVFDAEKCTGCGTCLTFCPHGAMVEE